MQRLSGNQLIIKSCPFFYSLRWKREMALSRKPRTLCCRDINDKLGVGRKNMAALAKNEWVWLRRQIFLTWRAMLRNDCDSKDAKDWGMCRGILRSQKIWHFCRLLNSNRCHVGIVKLQGLKEYNKNEFWSDVNRFLGVYELVLSPSKKSIMPWKLLL